MNASGTAGPSRENKTGTAAEKGSRSVQNPVAKHSRIFSGNEEAS